MTPYSLLYTPDALEQLVAAKNAARDPEDVVAASKLIAPRLTRSPKVQVDLLAEGLLAVNLRPLRLYYWIDEPKRTVRVVGVKLLRGHAGWRRPGGASGSV